MTKTQYLDMRGFNPLEWDVLNKETSLLYATKEGAINKMYEVKEPKAIAVFGKNSYIVNKEWMKQFTDIAINNDAIEEAVVVGETFPDDLPENSKPSVPPVPKVPEVPKVPVPPVPKNDRNDEMVQEKSSLLKLRIGNLIAKGWDDSGISMDRGIESVFYKDLEEMESKEWIALLNSKPENDEDDDPEFFCEKYDNTGELCEEQCKFCKEAEINGNSVEEQKKVAEAKIASITANDKNDTIEVVPEEEDDEKEQEELRIQAEEQAKKDLAKSKAMENSLEKDKAYEDKAIKAVLEAEEVKKTSTIPKTVSEVKNKEKSTKEDKTDREAKKVKEKTRITTIPKADEKVTKYLDIVEAIEETLVLFKKTSYAIAVCKTVIESEDTPENKLKEIEKAILNIDTL